MYEWYDSAWSLISNRAKKEANSVAQARIKRGHAIKVGGMVEPWKTDVFVHVEGDYVSERELAALVKLDEPLVRSEG
jgi:hypothetical protein